MKRKKEMDENEDKEENQNCFLLFQLSPPPQQLASVLLSSVLSFPSCLFRFFPSQFFFFCFLLLSLFKQSQKNNQCFLVFVLYQYENKQITGFFGVNKLRLNWKFLILCEHHKNKGSNLKSLLQLTSPSTFTTNLSK